MSILTPEAHRDPYIWAAVLLAHVAIGCMGWILIGWWTIALYGAWEIGTALRARFRNYADSVLDAVAVGLGMNLPDENPFAVAAIVIILAAGTYARRA